MNKHQYNLIASRPTLCEDGKQRYLLLELDTDTLLSWLGGKAKTAKTKSSHEARGAVRVRLCDNKDGSKAPTFKQL